MSILYYYPIVNIFNLGVYFLLEYLTDQEMFADNIKATALNVGLWAVEKYTVLKDIYLKRIHPHISFLYENNEGNIICYNKNTKINNVSERVPINVMENRDEYLIYYNATSVVDNIQYNKFVQIHENDDVLVKIDSAENIAKESPFIQVEYHGNNEIIDITQNIKDYCVEGNILNRAYFEYILFTNHNISINNETTFVIKIMDANINMLNIESSQTIIIGKNNTYIVE